MAAAKPVKFEEILIAENVCVEGLPRESVQLQDQQSLGDSGEVFDHHRWRVVFLALWKIASCRPKLLNLLSKLLFRMRSEKLQHAGKAVLFSIPLPPTESEERKELNHIIGTSVDFKLYINFPTGQSNVNSMSLTPERIKCVMRPVIVTCLLRESRYPATSMAIGYGSLCDEIKKYETYVTMDEKKREEMFAADNSDEEVFKFWVGVAKGMDDSKRNYLTSGPAVSGCVSSKEIYIEDDNALPGCIWWSGVHALMTDISNWSKSESSAEDKKLMLKNSDFFGDFKRKQHARNIYLTDGPDYVKFLTAIRSAVARNLRAGSQISADERKVMEVIYSDFIDSKAKSIKGTKPLSIDEEAIKNLQVLSLSIDSDAYKILDNYSNLIIPKAEEKTPPKTPPKTKAGQTGIIPSKNDELLIEPTDKP